MNRPMPGAAPSGKLHGLIKNLISSYLFGGGGTTGLTSAAASNNTNPAVDTQGNQDTYKIPTPEEEALKAQQATDPLFQYNGNYF